MTTHHLDIETTITIGQETVTAVLTWYDPGSPEVRPRFDHKGDLIDPGEPELPPDCEYILYDEDDNERPDLLRKIDATTHQEIINSFETELRNQEPL